MQNPENLLAHYDIDRPQLKQLLIEHLISVATKSKELGSILALENITQLIGLLHDFGKYKHKFQLYIRGEYKGRVNHSSAGAIVLNYIENVVFKEYNVNKLLDENNVTMRVWRLYKEIIQYPILSHHGLFDIISGKNEYRMGKRLQTNESNELSAGNDLEFLEVLNSKYRKLHNVTIYDLYYQGFMEFTDKYKRIREMASEIGATDSTIRAKSLHFFYGALTRLLLSILKDADIYDSSNFYRRDKDKTYSQNELESIWAAMNGYTDELYEGFRNNIRREIDQIRTDWADEVYEFSMKYGKGAFRLDMPVGSGKTYAGLRYAIGNAKEFKKRRIFYTTAFLSVLEQNASVIREVLGEEHILEHHSNVIRDYDGPEEEKDRREYELGEYLQESWESPVILTTLVQLANTMFKDKAANIRRFSKLINSVIVIDEIQSLPSKAIYNFNLMTNFMSNIMNVTIIHSTATPPGYDNEKVLVYPCIYGAGGKNVSVLELMNESLEVFERVEYYSLLGTSMDIELSTDGIVEHIKEQLEDENSVLIVLNTKRAVSNLYNTLIKDSILMDKDTEIIYLTTNQCPVHRLEIIDEMKSKLTKIRDGSESGKLICVSTKLVEAGVDIDFDIAYRSLAGIDNIIQVGGRCNREGKKEVKGRVFIFKYKDENLSPLQEILKQRDASETALKILQKENSDKEQIDIERAIRYYFQKLYQNEGQMGNHLEFMTGGNKDTILSLLSNNTRAKRSYEIHKGKVADFILRQGFKTAAMEFNLIRDDTVSVIVQYKNKDKIEELYNAIDNSDYYMIKRVLQSLQPYCIGIRKMPEYGNYISKQADGEILILNQEDYDSKLGLIKGELQSLIY